MAQIHFSGDRKVKLRLDYSHGSCIVLAVLCLTVPLDWIAAAFFAALVHELSHVLAVLLMGGRIESMMISERGAVMDVSPMTSGRKLICILAGPAGSLGLMAVCRYFPKTALCGLMQGAYNLLPIYPLDGGQAVRCVLDIICSPQKSEKWCGRISVGTVVIAVIVLIFSGFRWDLGSFPVMAAGLLVHRWVSGKICLQRKPFGSTIGTPYKMR